MAFDWLLRRMTRIDPGGRVAGVGGVPGELPNTELVASLRRSPVVLVVQDGGPPMVSEQPLGPSASLALAADRLYLTPGNRPEFRVLRPDGTVERIVR